MIAHRLLWPILQYRLRDPREPDWLHRCIQKRIQATVPPSSWTRWTGVLLLGPVLPALGLRGVFRDLPPEMILLLFMLMLLWCVRVYMIVEQEGAAAVQLLRTAQSSYAAAHLDVCNGLTAHERMMVAEHERRARDAVAGHLDGPPIDPIS